MGQATQDTSNRRLAKRLTRPLLTLAFVVALTSNALGDIVFYQVPGLPIVVRLQGKATVNPGRTISYRHPKFGKLTLGMKSRETRIVRAPTNAALFTRRMGRAKMADDCMDASRWALRNGLLNACYEAVDRALKLDPNHEGALRVKQLKRKIDMPLEDTGKEEQFLRRTPSFARMKTSKSKHYILMHDTPDRPEKNRKLPRAQERLELLEKVYESFLLRFYSQGIELELPKERLMVVLFAEYQDYLDYATALSPTLSSASGFWSGDTNVAVFYDQGTHKSFKPLVGLAKALLKQKEQAIKDRSPGARELVRMADTISLLIEISRENQDIEVVSHECTHQMAGNTGLLPRQVMAPTWAHEGLATYFETPNDASWSGVGAVNEQRLDLYKELASDREHSNMDFIMTDEIFDLAATNSSTLHGYGQAWALTHFLMERHFDKLIEYYRRMGQMPPHVKLNPALLKELFYDVFGPDIPALQIEWRSYMRGLKTDIDQILDEAK